MSLRERVYAAVLTTYKPGEQIRPYVIAEKCHSVDAVLHMISSFAKEGVFQRKLPVVCPHCGSVHYVASEVVSTGCDTCSHCGEQISFDPQADIDKFVYFVPERGQERSQ